MFVYSGGLSNQEFFRRLATQLTELLSSYTAEGMCYRVDLRLRPHGTTGPATMSLEAMLQYYDRHGRTWERQAWVKARCIAGDEGLGARLLAEMEPWVYRRWLTRADISGIKAPKRRIENMAIREGTEAADVKNGRGGIRDVEFTIQDGKLFMLQTRNGKRTAADSRA